MTRHMNERQGPPTLRTDRTWYYTNMGHLECEGVAGASRLAVELAAVVAEDDTVSLSHTRQLLDRHDGGSSEDERHDHPGHGLVAQKELDTGADGSKSVAVATRTWVRTTIFAECVEDSTGDGVDDTGWNDASSHLSHLLMGRWLLGRGWVSCR